MPLPNTTTPSQPQWQTRHWHTGTRYYTAEILPDLFGDWVLRRSWGSRTSKRGNSQTIHTTSYAEALTLMKEIHKRRISRGYQPSHNDNA